MGKARNNPNLLLIGASLAGVGLLGLLLVRHGAASGQKFIASAVTSAVTSGEQATIIARAFAESRGVPYSWAGGHNDWTWPRGGPGKMGGVGWDCSGWVMGVIKTFAPDSKLSRVMGSRMPSGTEIWKHFGSPRNSSGSKIGDIAFWGNSGGLQHVGFLLPAGRAVSAFGGGSKTNANDPNACVKEHGSSESSTGLRLIGTASWL